VPAVLWRQRELRGEVEGVRGMIRRRRTARRAVEVVA
jgi:hypothetical protein